MNWRSRLICGGLAVFTSVVAVPAVAAEFELGAFEGSFNSQISLGASWRMSEKEPLLVTPGSAPGFGMASTGTADDGDLNFEDGDIFSLILKGIHDLELRKGDFGVFVRAKYWYDEELANGKRPHGNSVNLYTPNQPLSDSGFDDFAQASGIELLDAFIYNTFYLGENGAPLDVRLGRQVVSWGESTFIQNGVNSINPIDVSAFRRPGAEIKEGLLPVAMVTFAAGVTDALSIEAFYQLKWEKTVIDGCGTYFSTADIAATSCDVVTLRGNFSDQFNMANGLFITRQPDIEPDDSGQFGVAIRYFAEKLAGSEFGLYYMNYHSRIPYLGGFTQSNTLVPVAAIPAPLITALTPSLGTPPWPFVPGNLLGGNPEYFAVFPEDIELFGVSVATNFAGFAVSGEVSYRPDFPVQINSTELLQGAVALAPWSTVLPRIIEVGEGAAASGYDLLPVTQAQVTFIRFFDQVLGASRLTIAAEIGANWVGDLPEQSVQRYGRNPTYGMGDFTPIPLTALFGIPPEFVPPALQPELAGNLACDQPFFPSQDFLDFLSVLAGQTTVVVPIVPNTNSRNCTTDGYVTDSSWGYRIRAGLTYNDVFAGINLTPSLAWSHDVDGYSPNSNFNEGAKALTVSLAAEYLNRYTGSLAYTTFSGGDYNTVEDRDFLSLSVAVSF